MSHARCRQRALATAALVSALGLTACGNRRPGPRVPAGPASDHVQVRMHEWGIALSLSVRKAAPGRVSFTVHNAGLVDHELVVIATRRLAGRLPLVGGLVNERAAGTTVGEIDDIAPGQTRRLIVTLHAGHYALICDDPGPPPHYRSGMHADFWVS